MAKGYFTRKASTKTGFCKELEGHVFDYGNMAVDKMRTAQENVVQYVGTKFGGDVANKLQNHTPIMLTVPDIPASVLHHHTLRETNNIHSQQNSLLTVIQATMNG